MKENSLRERIRRITYMQTSLGLFILSLVIVLVLWIRSVASNGALTLFEGFLGVLALAFCLTGFAVPLYGRFVVKAPDRPDYRLGLLLNGILALILVFLYILGI